MKRTTFHLALGCCLTLLLSAAVAQIEPASQNTVQEPVSYASLSQINSLLSQLEQAGQSAQLDLAKLRVEKWKADSTNKRQMQSNVDSVQRNLHDALPEIIQQVRSAPDNLSATFKLYRNVSALYDVFSSVVESAGAFGSKDEFQLLANDLSSMDRARRAVADRMEILAGSKEVEITRLRAELQKATTVTPPTSTKKVIVDDTAPPPKPATKKKPAAPKAATTPAPTAATPKP